MPRAAKNPVTGVTPQQEQWCYHTIRLGDPNKGYRAAYKADGMTQMSVRAEVSRLMDNPTLTQRLRHYQEVADKKLEVSIERIAKELARIGFSDPADLCDDDGHFLPLHMLPEDVRRAVQSVKIIEKAGSMKISTKEDEAPLEHVSEHTKEIRFWSKPEALTTMAKWKKMLVDRVETGKPGEFEATEDLETRIRERSVRLGLAKVLPIKGKAA